MRVAAKTNNLAHGVAGGCAFCVLLAHTHSCPDTCFAFIISSIVAFILHAAARTRVAWSALRARASVSIERVAGASLAFGSLLARLGDELLARTTLRDCQRREQLFFGGGGKARLFVQLDLHNMRWWLW